MVTIRMFIPHNNMKQMFEDAVRKYDAYPDIKIELIHIFGTPESLRQQGDADILVARGMTYDRLRELFPQTHVIEIHFSGFDVLDALLNAKNQYHPKVIAVCIRRIDQQLLAKLEDVCHAKILYYCVSDEASTEAAIEDAAAKGAEVFVGAGTMCGLCDRRGLTRIHIHTQMTAIERALSEAVEIAVTLNHERARNSLTEIILNTSQDGLITLDEDNRIMSINNQAYRILQLSHAGPVRRMSIREVCPELAWSGIIGHTEVIPYGDRQLYVESTPILVDNTTSGVILTIRDTAKITEAEKKIRAELVKQGLTAKYSFDDIFGACDQIRRDIQIAKRYSQVDSNVLIVGETGTGKELFAHSIHRASRRSGQPFVALNCAALPESLLESELFGYEAGAFSGASRNGKIGLFELANKGTIFLDEIGEIPVSLQAKLLRVLQEREIRRIGSTKVVPIDVRVISATNINIHEKIRDSQFRSDLYYRLNVLNLPVPPLRERGKDVILLAEQFLTRYACSIGKPVPQLTDKVRSMMLSYPWPGNVRELRNICERMTVLADSDVIGEEDLEIFAGLDTESVPEKKREEIPDYLLPKETKDDLARRLGISRTTLWRREKRGRR